MKYNYRSDEEYYDLVKDILTHDVFLQMKNFIQHGQTTTMEHCISVSYYSYKYCKKRGLDYKSAARGALLHDMFLYDWHKCVKDLGIHFHGFTHPRTALENAFLHFNLTNKEKDIILKHMWPLTIVPPKNREGFVVMYYDKYCGLLEMFDTYRIRKYNMP